MILGYIAGAAVGPNFSNACGVVGLFAGILLWGRVRRYCLVKRFRILTNEQNAS